MTTNKYEVLSEQVATDAGLLEIEEVISEVTAVVPPLWPLQDYVAVNPFVGFTDQPFLESRSHLLSVRECEMLPSWPQLRESWHRGDFRLEDIEAAIDHCCEEYPDLFVGCEPGNIVALLEGKPTALCHERSYYTASEAIDHRMASSWTSHFINDITRHCSAHFDQGQAAWPNPWKNASLYEAWKDASARSWRIDLLGVRGFRRLVAELPGDPSRAIEVLLNSLSIPHSHWQPFLQCQLLSVFGWASFIRYKCEQADDGRGFQDLIGLLAMRLAYDAALASLQPVSLNELIRVKECDQADVRGVIHRAWNSPARFHVPEEALIRYALLTASELAYERKLVDALVSKTNGPSKESSSRKSLQAVFCIDVRSEIFRRNLENADDSIETFGFAGFFGMPLEYVPFGEAKGTAQCPVLIKPSIRASEELKLASPQQQAEAGKRRSALRHGRKLWKAFQTSATSCFSFVESVGLVYAIKLLTDSMRWTRPIASVQRDGLPKSIQTGPALYTLGQETLSQATRVELAAGMLRNLGLTESFAPVVVLCGHGTKVVNNPYRAGLDCGACGGHSGESNARVAASLLNDSEVRKALLVKGIAIPHDTRFVPAVHHTTTDEVELLDLQDLPPEYLSNVEEVYPWIKQASAQARAERSHRLGELRSDDVYRRSCDWAEVRPEWGLAGNAAFIVAPRHRTKGLNLDGRTFMHSYDWRRDPEGKVLELIMTAPMVVTNWINLQYFASTVDNRSFGSGNKLIHNVVGQFGILEGNGGDLMTGLPWQSLHDGEKLQHKPLRLLVIIESPRAAVEKVIEKHGAVKNLVSNGWLKLMVLDQEHWYRWTNEGKWREQSILSGCKDHDPDTHSALVG